MQTNRLVQQQLKVTGSSSSSSSSSSRLILVVLWVALCDSFHDSWSEQIILHSCVSLITVYYMLQL